MSTIAIQPIGAPLKTDDQGFIISDSSVDKIGLPWKEVVDRAVLECESILKDALHSIYVRGSVSRGMAVEGISDLDMVVLIKQAITDEQKLALEVASSKLEGAYPFCAKVELGVHEQQAVLMGRDRVAAHLKMYAACVYGDNLIPQLPKVKIGPDVMLHAFGFNRAIKARISRIESGDLAFSPKACQWIMKRIIRSGGELIMERERVYVRDLYPCYQLFSKHYPDQEEAMKKVLWLCLNPTSDLAEVKRSIQPLSDWLEAEVERIYGKRL
jgi:hypothetical protein